MFLNFEKLQKGSVICRYGDQGDKFYLIFSGRIAVLVPKKFKIKMNYIDYLKYLHYLLELKEYGLALEAINLNISIYNSRDILDMKQSVNKRLENEQEDEIIESPTIPPLRTNNMSNYDVVLIEEYLYKVRPKESIDPRIDTDNTLEEIKKEEELNTITALIYFQVAALENSHTFGAVSLSDAISNRTTSIICLEDSTCGSLILQIYKKYIRSSQEGIRRLNTQCLYTNALFEGISMESFNKNYFNYFRLIELSLGESLFTQGEKKTELFFLKEGEIQLLTSSSLNNLDNLEHLRQTKTIKENKSDLRFKSNAIKRNFTQIRPNLKLVIYNQRNVIGIDDCVYNGNFFITAKCKSQKASVYAVDYNFFIQIMNTDRILQENFERYVSVRKGIMITRLKQIKEIICSSKLIPLNDNYLHQEDTSYRTRKVNNKTYDILHKTAINRNYLRKRLLTEKATLANNSYTFKTEEEIMNTLSFKKSPTAKKTSNITYDSNTICTTKNTVTTIPETKIGDKTINNITSLIYNSSSKNKMINNNSRSQFSKSRIIALDYNQNQYFQIEGTVAWETIIGKYIENGDSIKKTKKKNQVTLISSNAKSQMIKFQNHFIQEKVSNNSKTGRNKMINQSNRLICSQIDILGYENAILKTKEKTL